MPRRSRISSGVRRSSAGTRPRSFGGERQARGRITERPFRIRVPVAVEDEIEAGARPELDQIERKPRLAGPG